MDINEKIISTEEKIVSNKQNEQIIMRVTTTKREGSTYIYIIPQTPFDDFYSFWNEKIKIKWHTEAVSCH